MEFLEAKDRLAGFFPRKYCPASDFDWNCLYQIYRKRMEKAGF